MTLNLQLIEVDATRWYSLDHMEPCRPILVKLCQEEREEVAFRRRLVLSCLLQLADDRNSLRSVKAVIRLFYQTPHRWPGGYRTFVEPDFVQLAGTWTSTGKRTWYISFPP